MVVTSQEDLDAVLGDIQGAKHDFSKIQGRFKIRLSLSSANVDEVIKRRLLEKVPEAEPVLASAYEGKQDMVKRVARQVRAWRHPDSRFVLLMDQDSGDCKEIKSDLVERCREGGRTDCVVRVACRELEAWFIGDWSAVAEAFRNPRLEKQRAKAPYRTPDQVVNPLDVTPIPAI